MRMIRRFVSLVHRSTVSKKITKIAGVPILDAFMLDFFMLLSLFSSKKCFFAIVAFQWTLKFGQKFINSASSDLLHLHDNKNSITK